MKTNEAPEKIYLEKVYPDNGVLPNGLNYSQSPNDIEYTRTDAFIEKACEWLSKHARKYYFNKDGRYLGTDELVEDFELSMKL
jgi:hypothetical protein